MRARRVYSLSPVGLELASGTPNGETMRKIAFVSFLIVAACGPTQTTYPAGAVNPLALEPPPIYSLLGYRERLELTSGQVEALDSIAQDVKRRNDPLVDSLRVVAAARSGRARGIIPITDETRPVLERVRDQNRAAVISVQDVLSQEQQTQVCQLFEQTRQDRERSSRERDRPRQQIAPADTALFLPIRGWSWCGPPSPA